MKTSVHSLMYSTYIIELIYGLGTDDTVVKKTKPFPHGPYILGREILDKYTRSCAMEENNADK